MIRIIAALAAAALAAGWCSAAEPVTVELQAQSKVRTSVVSIGSVARLSGGDAALRESIARLDVADLKPHEQNIVVSRRVVEYRLRLAGVDPASVRIAGADRVTVTPDRRVVTADEVVAAAKAEVVHWLSMPRETVSIELARPLVVPLPEAPADEAVSITASPHVKPVGLGRIQMHVVISTATEKLLALGVDLEVKPLNRAANPQGPVTTAAAQSTQPPGAPGNAGVMQASASAPAGANPPASNAVLVQCRQRVTMVVHSGGLNVSAVGEAQQEGRFGQNILVQNVDSKKIVSARVTGPATVEIDIEPK
jgi:hypothetical protein